MRWRGPIYASDGPYAFFDLHEDSSQVLFNRSNGYYPGSQSQEFTAHEILLLGKLGDNALKIFRSDQEDEALVHITYILLRDIHMFVPTVFCTMAQALWKTLLSIRSQSTGFFKYFSSSPFEHGRLTWHLITLTSTSSSSRDRQK